MPDADEPSAGPPDGPVTPALLDALATADAIRTYVVDRDLRIVRAGGLTLRATPEPLRDRLLSEEYELDDPQALSRALAAPNGTAPAPAGSVRGRRTDEDGRDRTFAVAFHPLPGDTTGPGGTPGALLVLAADVTRRERARSRAAALDAVRERVGQSLDLATTCEDLVDALVPRFADIAVVEIVDDALHGADAPEAPPSRGTPLRRIAFRGPRGTAGAAHPLGDVREMPHPTPYALALGDLRPRLVTLGPDTPWYPSDPDRARAIEEFGAHSLIVVPLALRGTALGILSFYRCGGSEPYDGSDLAFAATLAAHTALSVDNARRYERDHSIASTVQRRLLPPGTSTPVAVETAHVYLPGRNSGCWFDAIPLSGARTALVVGRVDGHGVQAATTMGQLRTAVRTLAALDLPPAELLAHLGDTTAHLAAERAALPLGDSLRHRPLVATCLYGVYDPFTRIWTVGRAGHSLPHVTRPDGTPQEYPAPEGPPLGSSEGTPFVTTDIPLEPGSLLVLHSGSRNLEARSGTRPVDEVLAPAGRSLREIGDAIIYNYPADAHPDGAVLLLARPSEVAPDRAVTVRLPDDESAPSEARTLVRAHLTGWNIPKDVLYAVELIVSELVTNAVRYGTPPLSFRLIRTHVLTCEVRDHSSTTPHLRHARTGDEGGRGLFIMSQLATSWGTRYTADAKIVWAEVEL
ncbi:SpoIIE family protein phosphatase [uncultured Streptomyces sp.]|uniref:ATP-binding SpoIIE family protein phosphatase n=1 Tax=uncultured Streptomyces sp. TaxID=174707 RepID=UPI0026119CB3|nr:SpoIIE family protein phosphatase [uncultured Streptomyces sp.]